MKVNLTSAHPIGETLIPQRYPNLKARWLGYIYSQTIKGKGLPIAGWRVREIPSYFLFPGQAAIQAA